jgi:signal transduction histidine kinase/predicted RNA-binding protein with RPS1 domain/ActR/RegA family two-component response regulator
MKDTPNRELVPCTVIAHQPFGLLVELESGEKGIVRIRETSWDANQRAGWKRQFPVGVKCQAVIIKRPEDRFIELSLRLVEDDPWAHVREQFQEGQIVTGVVTGVKHYGVFIELRPGLTGLLHQTRLPSWARKNPLELFWPGDLVKVQIQQIDGKEQQIDLASAPVTFMDRAGGERSAGGGERSASDGRPAPRTSVETSGAGMVHRPYEMLQSLESRRYIVVVEDDLEQGKEIENWLENLGQRVRRALTAEEGLELLEKDPPDLLIADLDLPGMNGVALLRSVRERWPQIRCVLNTSWTRIERDPQEFDALQRSGVLILFKPLLPDDLLDLLLNTENDPLRGRAEAEPAPQRVELVEPPLPDIYRTSLQSGLRKLLVSCVEQTEFDMAVLFRLDPVHRKVDILYQYGEIPGVQPFLDDLIYSPVRDVAEDGDLVKIGDINAGSSDARFRYLLRAYPFNACIGVKIPNKLVQEYALFLFDTQTREIYDDEVAFTLATALAAGSLLERKLFTDQLRASQKMTMLGHLSSYLAHEMNHGLSPLNNSIRNLSVQLENLAAAHKQRPDQVERELNFAQDLLKDVRRSVLNLTSTVRAFRDLLSVGQKQIVNMDELVEETLSLLHQTSMVSKVALISQPGESLMAVRSQMPLLQHVLLNLVMNAIEQITEIRPAEGGQVRIRVSRAVTGKGEGGRSSGEGGRASQEVIRIQVEDNGPGIHWRLWEKIFDAGFTTRKDGSGLGLFISRNIVESLGGRIYVAESYINFGTVFSVDLPYQI